VVELLPHHMNVVQRGYFTGLFRVLAPTLSSFGEERDNYFVGRFPQLARFKPNGRQSNLGLFGLARARSLGPRGPSPSVEFLSPFPKRLKSVAPLEHWVCRRERQFNNRRNAVRGDLHGRRISAFIRVHLRL